MPRFLPPATSNQRQGSLRLSACQMEYAQSLAGRLGMDAEQLDGLCGQGYEKPLAELAGGEASGLIRTLQEIQGWQEPDAVYRPDGE
jgi:hypothetical protein